jgi:hypothetical protein
MQTLINALDFGTQIAVLVACCVYLWRVWRGHS